MTYSPLFFLEMDIYYKYRRITVAQQSKIVPTGKSNKILGVFGFISTKKSIKIQKSIIKGHTKESIFYWWVRS